MLNLFKTTDDWTGVILRLTIAVVLFPHGAQKLLGWWSGAGYEASMKYFTETVGLPAVIGWLVIVIEFFGPVLLFTGLASRISALLILIVMIGIIATFERKYFFMNWFGTQKMEGIEFFLLMIGLCIAVIITGSGKYSIDQLLDS